MTKARRVAVTGSAGFIGSHLVPVLKENGWGVEELDLKTGIDITDWGAMKDIGPFDVLVHLAGGAVVTDSFREPRRFLASSMTGTLNMLELCSERKSFMIYASSAHVYASPRYLPLDEAHPVLPSSPYALSKLTGEHLCRGYHQFADLDVGIVRAFNVYGEGQSHEALIPSILKQAMDGAVVLKDPLPRRDFVYVDDLIVAYVKLIELGPVGFEAINVGSGKSHSVREVVDIVCEALGEKASVTFTNERRKGEIPESVADIGKARGLLKWQPRYDLRRGIHKMLEMQRQPA
jgi:nucleoside-diphosphate-sugar epimerase